MITHYVIYRLTKRNTKERFKTTIKDLFYKIINLSTILGNNDVVYLCYYTPILDILITF